MTAPVSSLRHGRRTAMARAAAAATCVLAAGGSLIAANAQAQVPLGPNPNPVDNTITIESGTEVWNIVALPFFDNQGTIQINSLGILKNYIQLDNSTTGFINNDGSLLNATYSIGVPPGIVNNYGTLNNFSKGVIQNEGLLTNFIDASVNNHGYFYNIGNDASVINRGSLVNTLQFENEGSLLNSRNIENSGQIYSGFSTSLAKIENSGSEAAFVNSGGLSSSGQLINANNAKLIITSTGFLGNGGLFDNSGGAQLINNGSLSNGGNFYNSSLLVNNGAFGNGGLLRNNGGSLTNSAGAVLRNDGNLFNENGATLLNAVDQNDESKLGTIENYGNLNNSATFENYGTLTNFTNAKLINDIGGVLQNRGLLYNEANGIVDNKGDFYNQGTYWTTWGSGNGTLRNSGAFVNQGELNVVGTIENNANGTFTNAADANLRFFGSTVINAIGAVFNNLGKILLSNPGSLIQNNGIFNNGPFGYISYGGTVNNSGTLNNGPHATFVTHDTLTNDGLIVNSGNLYNSYTSTQGTLTNNGSVVNSGFMYNYSRAYNNNVIVNDGTFTNIGTFENTAGAVVSGTGTYIQTSGLTRNNGTMTQSCFDIRGGSVVGNGEFNSTCLAGMNLAAGTLLSAGNSPGKITINGNLTSGADMLFEIAGTASGKYDVLDINGAAEFLGGLITIEFIDGYLPGLDDTFNFIVADSSIGWDKLKWAVTGLGADFEWNIAYGNGGAYIDITAVPGTGTAPEPGTYALVLAGLGLMGFMSRRRRALAV